jgi:hypothetical protein
MEKKKKKDFRLWWAGGQIPAQPGAGRARAREKRRRGHGAHVPGRAGGETASAADGARANRPTAGENPAASGFDSDSPPVIWFLGIRQAP